MEKFIKQLNDRELRILIQLASKESRLRKNKLKDHALRTEQFLEQKLAYSILNEKTRQI